MLLQVFNFGFFVNLKESDKLECLDVGSIRPFSHWGDATAIR
jgi:hypothetical protein